MTIVVTTDEDLRRIIREETRELREALLALRGERAEQPNPLLTVDAVASRCSVTTTTVRSWIHSGNLPARRAGRRYLVHHVDLDAFLASSNQEPELDPKKHLTILMNRLHKSESK